VALEMEFKVHSSRAMGIKRERPVVCNSVEGDNLCQVLYPDRNPQKLVLVVHEEAINQFPRMAYFGGIFSGGEVCLRAMDYILEYPYPMRAIIDVAGHWRLKDFCCFSIVHLILLCFNQCLGH
jgi:hypothetical protein